jgi:hypothetical protein
MKRLLYALLAGIGVLLLTLVVGIGFSVSYPNATKAFSGQGKRISNRIKAEVTIDGNSNSDAHVFRDGPRDYLVFEDSKSVGVGLLIINRETQQVELPNGNAHDFIFSRFLYVSHPGLGGVPMKSAKFDFDPQLVIDERGYEFVFGGLSNVGARTIRVTFS